MARRILVTGGAGFIGSHITDVLVENGFDVFIVDDFSHPSQAVLHESVKIYKCDITSSDLEYIIRDIRPECVIHQAAQISVQRSVTQPCFDATVNIIGSINVLEASARHGVRKIVYASSAAVYGNPKSLPIDEDHPICATSAYGISKHTVEHYVQMYHELYGLEYTVLRYANVYGPRQDPSGEGGVVAIFMDRVLSDDPCIVYGTGEQTRDFIHVRDVAMANLLAIDRGDGCILNVSSQRETSVNELVNLLCKLTGKTITVEYAPERPGDIRRSVLANKRIRESLGWSPQYNLTMGLRQMLREYESRTLRPPN